MRDRFLGALGLGQDQTKPKEVSGGRSIEIGGSNYFLSPDAEKFISVVQYSEYPKSKSVLILEEPHYDFEAQKNLYRFLEVFFKDNPTLVPKTIFLSEGYPAGQTLDLAPLIREEPNPSEALIEEVLNTFLITGYMAYEWKYQQGIPIIGTEDEVLHQFSGKVWSDITEETSPFWKLSVVLRNRSMTAVLKEKMRVCENPVLFVGGMHVNEHMSRRDMDDIIDHNLGSTLTHEEKDHLLKGDNLGIYDYLALEKVGFNFVSFRGELGSRYEAMYRKLFHAQGNNDYEGYIKWYMKETGLGVTTRPSPEVAADFVRAFKNNPPQNPEARKSNERGLSLASQGKYAEAAGEFSAASAADTKVPGYVVYTQESAFREVKSRILRVIKDPEKGWKLKRGVKSDLPIFGPYIERDHYERVSAFAKRFAKVPGVQEVIDSAMSSSWKIRYGGAFQIKVADALGVENIRGFEEKYQEELQGKGWSMKVDIATIDNVAVECKNFSWERASSDEIYAWVKQISGRLYSDKKGHKYDGGIVVIPDGKNLQEIEAKVRSYINLYYPEFVGKIRICTVGGSKDSLIDLRRR